MANDGILHPFSIAVLSFIWEEQEARGQLLLGVGRERLWSRQDSSLIPLLSCKGHSPSLALVADL